MSNKIKTQKLISVLKAMVDGLAAIYLHGSEAKGRERPDSDLDIALLMRPGQGVSFDRLLQLAGELELIMHRPVHLSVLNTDQIVFVKEVITNGKRLYCTDLMYCKEFEMYGLAAYARLNEERKAVLESYRIEQTGEILDG